MSLNGADASAKQAKPRGERRWIALDANGADDGPAIVLEGARLAAAEGIGVRLFGPKDVLGGGEEGIEVIDSPEEIGNNEEPVAAVRSRPESSIVRAAADVANGNSEALVSAGATGATLAASLFAFKRQEGVLRPALAAQVPRPTAKGKLLFLDAGANVECRPQHLIQFASLGSAFSEAALDIEKPRVGLLSVGEEAKKGTPQVAEVNAALAEAPALNFIGNIEGRDLFEDVADVVVTDGFTGNVALKSMEGTALALYGAVRETARSNPIAAIGALMLRFSMRGLRRDLDPNGTGGAILLGLRRVSIVAHGSSTPLGILRAVQLADHSVEEHAIERTADLLEASGTSRSSLRAEAVEQT